MDKVLKGTIVLIALLLTATVASADYSADITFDYVDFGDGSYTFDFTVNNTSTGSSTASLDYFMIDFDADPAWGYSNISWLSNNGWYALAYDPDLSFGGLPGGVLADDAAVFGGSGGISQGNSLANFSVNFDYAGSLLPEDQLFTFYADFGTNFTGGSIFIDDGFGGYYLEDEFIGTTRYLSTGGPGQQTPIPEPGTFVLLGAGLVALIGLKRKYRS